jgi:hypothetical protein
MKKKTSASSTTTSTAAAAEIAALKESNEESQRALAEMKLEMDGLEKERDFYFEKLRDVEIMLQDLEDKGQGSELSAAIFKILYATADGFEQVEGEAAADAMEPITSNTEGTTDNNAQSEEFVEQEVLEEGVVQEDSVALESMTSTMVEQETY